MATVPGTPRVNGGEDRRSYEFTPIGYVRNGDETGDKAAHNVDGRKRRSNEHLILEEQDEDEDEPAKKSRRYYHDRHDDTLNSTRLFNESSFDDSIPSQLPMQNGKMSSMGKAPELTEPSSSNPLKEQEESLYRLNTENYNLRVRCNSLLKFLNNVTDEGELRQNLELLDELQEWKNKYQSLSRGYRDLQAKIDSEEGKDSALGATGAKDSTDQLRQENTRLTQRSEHLEQRVSELLSQISEVEKVAQVREEQRHAQAELAKSITRDHDVETARLQRELQEAKAKIHRLESDLQEFDHQGGSLLALEKQLDLKNEGITNLETQLKEVTHVRQKLEQELATQRVAHDSYVRDTEQRLKELATAGDAPRAQLQLRLDELERSNTRLESQSKHFKATKEDLERALRTRQERILALEQEIKPLRDSQHTAEETSKREKQAYGALEVQARKLTEKCTSLQQENEKLKTRIVEQAAKSPQLKRNNRALLEKEEQLSELQGQLQDLKHTLAANKETLHELRLAHQKELDRLRLQIQDAQSEPDLINRRLQKELEILKFELDSVKETKARELEILETKYAALRKENHGLLNQDDHHAEHFQKLIAEKDRELSDLVKRCSDLTTQRLQLSRELSHTRNSENEYKEKWKAANTRLDYITKEFVNLRQATEESGRDPGSFNETRDARWLEKYQSMKKKLLAELKSMQDENLKLEKKFLQERSVSSRANRLGSDSLSLQDQLDYYMLRYRREVKHTNDLKVVNEYLNRVLKASSQHLRLDILKLESEMPNSALLGEPGPNVGRWTRAPRFKTVALFVLACVRLRRVATRSRQDAQRLGYLQRKIVLDQDKVTW
ncbi:LAMI_0E13322g1_1 [Lachancea mirantina]|uniref:Spindle pole body component 110 n=1 Tax=Lachancea mirantina TaxID=1230905 RepID=A0A1G4JQS5_9SACH|nr:LAMI_0E13322g1_1 [Lachancea mirantina]